MVSIAAKRYLGPWVLGLFLIAQTLGFATLLGGHVTHVAEAQLAVSEANAGTSAPPKGHHYHGDADGFIQHHELQDLNGTFTCPAIHCAISLTYIVVSPRAPDALTEADPILFERPPKHFPSI